MPNPFTFANTENSQTAQTTEKPLSSTISPFSSPLCSAACKTCQSPNISAIHRMRYEEKKELSQISNTIAKFGDSISVPSLSRHFSKFNEYMQKRVNSDILEWREKQIDFTSKHMLQLNAMINSMLDKIALNWGSFIPSVETLNTLFNIRYKTIPGQIDPSSVDEQMKALLDKVKEETRPNLFTPALPLSQTDYVEAETV